jgi:hypothetical protein
MPTIYGAVDLVKNELRNAVMQNLGSAPGAPVKGLMYFNSADNTLYWYDGTQWIAAKAAAGAIPAATVTTQAVGDAPVVGTGTNYAREDHKHGREAFAAPTAETTFGTASAAGVAATVVRSDHTHGNPVHDAAAHTGLLGTVTAEPTFGSASSNGVATTLSRSDHAHGNPVHDNAAHAAISRSALAAPTADVPWGGFKITGLGTPAAGTDAANKTYVDGAINGLSWKDNVRLATTANITLSTNQTIDGVLTVTGDRVLVKNQTTPALNGIYIADPSLWARATDADLDTELLSAAVFVSEGSTQADTAWVMTTNLPITVGTTGLTWVQFGAGAVYSAGNGLTLTGNVFDVGAGSGILVAADTVAVDTAVIATRAYVDSGIGTTALTTAGAGLTKTGQTVDVIGGTGITVAADLVSVDTTVIATQTYVNTAVTGMAKKFAAALTGTASPEVITHNLNTRDVYVSVLNGATPYTAVQVDWDATTVNTVTIRYNPNLGAGYRAVVLG